MKIEKLDLQKSDKKPEISKFLPGWSEISSLTATKHIIKSSWLKINVEEASGFQ